jgi:hypothetical protein
VVAEETVARLCEAPSDNLIRGKNQVIGIEMVQAFSVAKASFNVLLGRITAEVFASSGR